VMVMARLLGSWNVAAVRWTFSCSCNRKGS